MGTQNKKKNELPKTRENAGKRGQPSRDWRLVLYLIGGEIGASFLNQSQGKVKQNQNNPGLLFTLN